MRAANPITPALISFLRDNFQLDWHGIHGVRHWARVKQIGLMLCRETGADPVVVSLFSFIHDSERISEYVDTCHGLRASSLVRRLNGKFYNLSEEKLNLLQEACEGHSDGGVQADVTVQTCWDADRLDLGRVGVIPDPEKLCTEAARSEALIEWCYLRSRA